MKSLAEMMEEAFKDCTSNDLAYRLIVSDGVYAKYYKQKQLAELASQPCHCSYDYD